jgi:hypothetical protein
MPLFSDIRFTALHFSLLLPDEAIRFGGASAKAGFITVPDPLVFYI